MSIDIKVEDIRKLTELMSRHNLSEINLESEDIKLSLKRPCNEGISFATPTAVVPQMIIPQEAPKITGTSIGVASTPVPTSEITTPVETIDSPLVGTFYSKSAPDAAPFVTEGTKVTENTVICIIEAMKVMNEIKAEKNGIIKKICCFDGTPVQFGQALFEIEPA